jgi:5-methyltetrahydropteroyltriglutamate--homocysteine methyltransferase
MALDNHSVFPHIGVARGFQRMLVTLGEGVGEGSVPTFTADQQFKLSWANLFDEVDEARAQGRTVRPAIIGPLTYLWLGQVDGQTPDFDKLDLLDRLLPVYGEILGRLAGKGVEWVQIDEPILTLDLPQDWKTAFERAYHALQYSPLKKLLAVSCSGLGLGSNLGLAVGLPVQGLHVDVLSAPEQMPLVLDRLPVYKVLSLGAAGELDPSGADAQAAFEVVKEAQLRFAENLWLAEAIADSTLTAAA